MYISVCLSIFVCLDIIKNTPKRQNRVTNRKKRIGEEERECVNVKERERRGYVMVFSSCMYQ